LAGLANGIGLMKIRGSIILLAGLLIAVNVHANEDDFPSEERSAFEDQPSAFVLEDPYESFNRSMFSFNESADKYFLKPIAQAYQFVTPSFLDEGITNVFDNLDDVETFFNSLLQGKFHNATVTLNRIIYNTVFGLGGFFDVATSFGLLNDEEDFGQTLAVWGYEQSDYLVLPFLGPSTFRDMSGFLVDGYLFDPINEMDDIDDAEQNALMVLKLVDKRADLLAAENLFVGGDKYVTLRNAFLQNREFLIKDGDIEDTFAEDDFEMLDGF
jgi:phospholipid-binding lipoprotein MlaA